MSAPAQPVRRWLLHPAAVAALLVLLGGLATWAAFRPATAVAGALALVAVAGAAAGFANSGST
ncbi:hypothetical protein BJF78_18305 [Pseudonocardia sp. CNS-139]|nr:hypothetical protein BJF78_18305 [Pseudonocardia sp. CNS-139]